MAAGACRISSGKKHDCQGLPSLWRLGLFAAFGKCEEATGEMQTWPAVLTLNSSTCGVSCEWDSCQTLPLEDTFLSGLGLLRKSRIPPPGQAAPSYPSLHHCVRFCLLLRHCENWGTYLYLCAQRRHSLAKCIPFHILTTAAKSQEKHLNLPGTANSPKSLIEK